MLVPEILCARCRNPVASGEGSLSFCPHCGAPQIFLSGELREQAAEQARLFAAATQPTAPASAPTEGDDESVTDRRSAPAQTPVPPGLLQWPAAVRSAGLLALIGAVFSLFALPLPRLGGMSFFWAMVAPILAVQLYGRRSAGLSLSAASGARLGLLTALFISGATAAVNVAGLVVSRFVTHTAGALDQALALSTAEYRSRLIAQMGQAAAAPALGLLDSPEIRVGASLLVLSIVTLLYLLLASLMGMTAGSLRPGAARR